MTVPRTSSVLGKIVIFLCTGKNIQVLVFDNWHPLKTCDYLKRLDFVNNKAIVCFEKIK